jgi:hypothetical protein
MVVSLIALFVALGGTSYAALKIPRNSVGSAQVINGSLQKGDLSTKAVAALKGNRGAQGAPGAQGAAGTAGATGAVGATGPAGAAGAGGAAGTARAYAEVNRLTPGGPADVRPSFVAARTKNFTAVTRAQQGVYCLTPAAGIDPRTVATAATEDFDLSTVDGFVEVNGTGAACPAGQFEVDTDDAGGTPTDGIAFHLIVP